MLGLADALSLELAQGFTPCPQTGAPAQVGGGWADVPAWGLAVGGSACPSCQLPCGSLVSSDLPGTVKKSSFLLRFQV